MKEILKRFKSPVSIAAVAALIAWVFKNWVGWEIPGWDDFITLVLALLACFGVVNNPADGSG